MALNWDKLSKLQRDYPKPKFAFNEVQRQLKKKQRDPYLLAWQADICARLGNGTGEDIDHMLQPLFERSPPITDLRLLEYLYRVQISALRELAQPPGSPLLLHGPRSAGKPAVKAYANVAKTLQNRNAKLQVWSELFKCALRNDCWDDARAAATQALQEGLKADKRAQFASVLANQMSYDVQSSSAMLSGQSTNMAAELPKQLAFRTMKAAFDNATKSPENSIKVEDLRDLRFMAQVFARQGRHRELFELWDQAPPSLKSVLTTYREDIVLLKMDIYKMNVDWNGVVCLCSDTILKAWEEVDTVGKIEPVAKILSNCWQLFGNYLEAARFAGNPISAESVRGICSSLLDEGTPFQGRPAVLTQMALTSFFKEPLLPLCKHYWDDHNQLSSCFHDLRRFVEQLDLQDQQEFHNYITAKANSIISIADFDNEDVLKIWLRAEVNVLKFDYMLSISALKKPVFEAVEDFTCSALRLYRIASRLGGISSSDAASLALFGFLAMSRCSATLRNDESPMRVTSPRPYLQAAILAQHLTSSKFDKQDRPFVLLSVRLQMGLGFASIALDRYRDVRIKEMLNNTVSHILLDKAFQIHPFDTIGKSKLSLDKELGNVISSIERMEAKTTDLVCSDIPDFKYDQAIELLDLRAAFASSMMKHHCVVQRRRMARLRGEMVDESLDLELRTFLKIQDNRDSTVLPDFECALHSKVWVGTPGNPPPDSPNVAWIYWYYLHQDVTCQLLHKEQPYSKIEPRQKLFHVLWVKTSTTSNISIAEKRAMHVWTLLKPLAYRLNGLDHPHLNIEAINAKFDELYRHLETMHKIITEIAFPDANAHKLAPVWLPSEPYLIFAYSDLEVLQACYRLVELAEEHRKRKDSPLKTKINGAMIQKLRALIESSYSALRKLTQAWIDHVKRKGRDTMKAQVQWGRTGAALKEVISDEDLTYYADEATDSLIDSLSGVLKVKLKR